MLLGLCLHIFPIELLKQVPRIAQSLPLVLGLLEGSSKESAARSTLRIVSPPTEPVNGRL